LQNYCVSTKRLLDALTINIFIRCAAKKIRDKLKKALNLHAGFMNSLDVIKREKYTVAFDKSGKRFETIFSDIITRYYTEANLKLQSYTVVLMYIPMVSGL
jgi:hypothetical protein